MSDSSKPAAADRGPVRANTAQGAPAPAEDLSRGPTVLRGEHREHGAQVVLGRKASAAARGAVGDTIEANTLAKSALEASGEEADGNSADGTSVTGKRQRDDVLADKTDDPAGPSTGVKADPDSHVFDAAGLAGTRTTPTPDGKGGPANATGAPAPGASTK